IPFRERDRAISGTVRIDQQLHATGRHAGSGKGGSQRMAPEGRTEDPDVSGGVPAHGLSKIMGDLRESPGAFEFFQAVRLLTRIYAHREPAGEFAPPDREAVRFSANASLAFPQSQIDSISWDSGLPRMSVNFMGLTGPRGTLPLAYSELIGERL